MDTELLALIVHPIGVNIEGLARVALELEDDGLAATNALVDVFPSYGAWMRFRVEQLKKERDA